MKGKYGFVDRVAEIDGGNYLRSVILYQQRQDIDQETLEEYFDINWDEVLPEEELETSEIENGDLLERIELGEDDYFVPYDKFMAFVNDRPGLESL